MKHFYIILILLFCSALSFAQNQGNKWYFGQYAALDFNSGSPVPILTGQLNTNEGCASIADKKTGNLLFYTDGTSIWDRTNNVMPNGYGLGGSSTSTQSAVAIPIPGSDSLYYVFTVDYQAGIGGTYGGVSYNIVNMSLNGGLGNVSTLDHPLLAPTDEKIAATYACNDTDIWVVIHQWNTNAFYAYLVTNAGISSPVISNSGIIHQDVGSGQNAEAIGYMKISPNGKMLALACYVDLNTVQIFDFNNKTGVVSNPITDTNYPNISGDDGPYGVSFSPDNSKLYVEDYTVEPTPSQVFQYDLQAGNASAIVASRTVVASNYVYDFGAMQDGPDGKIYIAKANSVTGFGADSLAVINNPNNLGAACNFINNGLFLGGSGSNLSLLGLPDLVENFLTPTYKAILSYTNCSGLNTVILVDSTLTDAATYYWNFGDTASHASDTSTIANPYHNFSSLDTYNVELILSSPCKTDTLRAVVKIGTPPVLSLKPPSSSICQGRSIVLNASGALSYQWMPSDGLNSTSDSSVIASLSITTTYTVFGSINGCSDTGQIVVNVTPGPVLTLTPPSTSICKGQSIMLKVSGGPSYQWNPSTGLSSTIDSNVIANPLTTTTYSVISSENGCSDTGQIVVTVYPIPVLTITPLSASICSGRSIELNATGALSYQWNPSNGLNSTTDSSVNASPSTTTTYTVVASSHSCSDTGQVVVKVTPSPVLTLAPTSASICKGQSIMLMAIGGSSYQWSPSAGLSSTADSSVNASPSITTTYSVSTTVNGCSDTAQIDVVVNPIPVLTITPLSTLICNGQGVTLTASGASLYTWNPSTGLSATEGSSVVATPKVLTTYSIIGTDTVGCIDSATVTVNVGKEPIASFASEVPDICHPQSIQFLNTSTDDSLDYWKFGDGTSSDFRSPLHTYNSVGYYNLTLITVSSSGCEDSLSILDTVISGEDFAIIPNAFTPDIKGVNSIFFPNILCKEASDFMFRIYDRWGILIYQSTNADSPGWNGKYKDKEEPLGVYEYYLSFSCGSCKITKKGNVALIR